MIDEHRNDDQRAAAGVPPTDAVDLLLEQHARAEELFRETRESTGAMRRDAFDDLLRLLAVHETIEEEIVHPLARRSIDAGDEIVEACLGEERDAKGLLAQFADMDMDDSEFVPRLDALRAAVLMHAKREERYEFAYLRAMVPHERLRALVPALRAAEKLAPARPHPGLESARATVAIGPVLADKARDLIRAAARDRERAH